MTCARGSAVPNRLLDPAVSLESIGQRLSKVQISARGDVTTLVGSESYG